MKIFIRFIILQVLLCNLTFASPIRLHPENSHYFLFRGKPTILITSAGHYGAVINMDFDYIKYLNTLQSDGLNYTRIFTGSYVENPKSFGIEKNNLAPAENRVIVPWARSSVPGYINGGNKFDLDKWDSEYFKRLKDFISEAGKRGIIVEVTLFSSTYQDGYWMFSPLHPSNNINNIDKTVRKKIQTLDNGNMLQYQEKMVRKIVRELKEYDNIFYEIQNEPWSDQTVTAHILNQYDEESNKSWKRIVDLASDTSLKWQETIVSYIKDEEIGIEHKHLIAQNYCNFLYPLENVLPDISIINFHYAWPDAASLNYGWNRVLNFDETGFAGKEDMTYRKQAWNFIISGGGAFNNLDYSFAVGYEDGTFEHKTSPGGGSVNLRLQLKVLKDFMDSFDFIRMRPNNKVIKNAPGVFARALAEAGKQYAIYIDGGEGREIELELPEGIYKADWINTKSGDIKKTEMFSHSGGYIILSSPQYNDDIALRILSNKLF